MKAVKSIETFFEWDFSGTLEKFGFEKRWISKNFQKKTIKIVWRKKWQYGGKPKIEVEKKFSMDSVSEIHFLQRDLIWLHFFHEDLQFAWLAKHDMNALVPKTMKKQIFLEKEKSYEQETICTAKIRFSSSRKFAKTKVRRGTWFFSIRVLGLCPQFLTPDFVWKTTLRRPQPWRRLKGKNGFSLKLRLKGSFWYILRICRLGQSRRGEMHQSLRQVLLSCNRRNGNLSL